MTESVSFEVVSSIQSSIDASHLDFGSDSEVEYSLPSSIPTSLAPLPGDTPVNKPETPPEIEVSHIDTNKGHIENPLESVENSKDEISNKLHSNFQSSLEASPGLLDATMCETITPIDDSGIVVENDLSVIDTDEENNEHPSELIINSKAPSKKVQNLFKKSKYKKPLRPCFFCKKHQSRLKRHILGKHKDEPLVRPLLKLSDTDQDRQIALMRKQGIRDYNMELLKSNETDFMRERRNLMSKLDQDLPVMCSGCKGFYAKSFKARHQLNCPASGTNLMVPVVSVKQQFHFDNCSSDFKELLNTIQLDEVGNYVKSDRIILMFGWRSFNPLRKKKDKAVEGRKTVRTQMRLVARLYLAFCNLYNSQTDVQLVEPMNNAADIYRRETILILGRTIDKICEKPDSELTSHSVSNQKSGLKIGILNLLKKTGHMLISHFLMECEDLKSNRVTEFFKVLKLFESELFGDAYYDLNYRRNRTLRKPVNLPKNDDVRLLMEECKKTMQSIDKFEHPANAFVNVRSAAVTALTIFCARRGGEPARLQIYQWNEAVNGEWTIKEDLPDEFDKHSMLITYQTGKGADHLVPIMFTSETIQAMKYLTDEQIRREAGVNEKNMYVFASTKQSTSHASG